MLDLLSLISSVAYMILLLTGSLVMIKRTSHHDADRAIDICIAAGTAELFALGANIAQVDLLGIVLNVFCLIAMLFTIGLFAITADKMRAEVGE